MKDKVKKFVNDNNIKADVHTRYIDLVSEVGELGKELLRGNDYNNKKFEVTDNTKMEIGDCLFSLVAICNELNIDPNEALDDALGKYNNRITLNKTISSK